MFCFGGWPGSVLRAGLVLGKLGWVLGGGLVRSGGVGLVLLGGLGWFCLGTGLVLLEARGLSRGRVYAAGLVRVRGLGRLCRS